LSQAETVRQQGDCAGQCKNRNIERRRQFAF